MTDDRNPTPDDLLQAIMTTRAIRRYTADPITDEEIQTCLKAAVQAPNNGNIQPWQFVVITDPDARRAVGDVYRKSYDRFEAAYNKMAPPPRDEADAAHRDRMKRASRYLADHIGEAPAMVAFLMPKIDLTMRDDEGPIFIGTTHASVFPAVQNFILAARSLGIGTAFTTVYRVHEDEVRTILGVPDSFEIVALVPMGRPRGKFGVAPRRPAEKVTHWNKYGNRQT
jgi:nitroreductase